MAKDSEPRGRDERDDPEAEGEEPRRKGPDNVLRDAVRRAIERGIEAGVGTFTRADGRLRGALDDVKLPREIASYLFSQIDDTKNAVVRVVAGEIRDFLDAADIEGEFYRALTSLSFEVRTEIRFIPNEAGGVRPQVKARTGPKRSGWKSRRGQGDPDGAKDDDAPADAADREGDAARKGGDAR
ncbi:MAG: hypothetical protein KC543_02305 [Myxococcales bacterium]|nr:hypothetical protein [Myxococcales bacterium]